MSLRKKLETSMDLNICNLHICNLNICILVILRYHIFVLVLHIHISYFHGHNRGGSFYSCPIPYTGKDVNDKIFYFDYVALLHNMLGHHDCRGTMAAAKVGCVSTTWSRW